MINQTLAVNIASLLFDDDDFLANYASEIYPELFQDQSLVWLTDKALRYFLEYKTHITDDVIETLIDGETDPRYNHDRLRSFYSEIPKVTNSSRPFYWREAPAFFRKQACVLAFHDAAGLIEDGKLDALPELYEKALKVGQQELGGLFLPTDEGFERLMKYHEKDERDFFKTGLHSVDKVLQGGLRRGELGVFLGPTGRGKSAILSFLASQTYSSFARSVVYFTLELNEEEIATRIISATTGKSLNKWSENPLIFKNLDISNTIADDDCFLTIRHFPMRGASVHTLDAYMDMLQDNGVNPGLMIVDYADIMQPSRFFGNSYEEQGLIYEELKGLAQKRDIAIWTASQANRTALSSEVVDLDSVADSFRKAMASDFMIALCQTPDEREVGMMRFYMAKVRRGITGWQINIACDLEKMQFQDAGRSETFANAFAEEDKQARGQGQSRQVSV